MKRLSSRLRKDKGEKKMEKSFILKISVVKVKEEDGEVSGVEGCLATIQRGRKCPMRLPFVYRSL
jgi:hypothetical protein